MTIQRSVWGLLVLAFMVASGARGGELGKPRDIAFTAACDQTSQSYVLRLPTPFDAGKRHHLLVALHGHGSDRWQFATREITEAQAVRDLAATHSMILLSPDYRATTSWMGPKAEADLVQMLQSIKKDYRIGKVILCGASMGGSSTLTFAALHPELIDGVASMNGTANHLAYENFQEAISASFGGTKQQIPNEYKLRSAEYWPERLTMPVGLAAGGQDNLVPAPSVLRLADVLGKLGHPVLMIYRENGGHFTTYQDAKTILEYAYHHAVPVADE